jgi:hypothetical protein
MTNEAFRQLMSKATNSVRLVNVGNKDLINAPGYERNDKPRDPAIRRLQDEYKGYSTEQLAALRLNLARGIGPSTDESKLNKTERRYLSWLRVQGDLWIGIQPITLKIGHDCRFTPDFAAVDARGMRLIDVKAKWGNKVHVEDDAQVKLSVAARLFPMFHFVIAWPEGQVWNHRSYKP